MDDLTEIENDRKFIKLRTLVILTSVALPLIVAGMFQIKFDVSWPFDVHLFPFINACLNGLTAVLLLVALAAVRYKNINLHKKLIYTSMLFSLLFLVVYVLYHISTQHTIYGGEGTIKFVYLIILASHIILAAVQAPFVLFAFLYGYSGQIEKHKKIVKFSYPIWLYVSITGVICYLMILPYYK